MTEAEIIGALMTVLMIIGMFFVALGLGLVFGFVLGPLLKTEDDYENR